MGKQKKGFAFTRYTSDALLTKRLFCVGDQSKAIEPKRPWQAEDSHPYKLKKIAAAMMVKGNYETLSVKTLEELDAELNALDFVQATGYGLAAEVTGKICTKKNEGIDGAISRSKKNFKFADRPGICMLDIDPRDGNDALSAEDAHAAIVKAMPELGGVRMLCRASASSNVWLVPPEPHPEELLRGPGGWHFYFFVKSAKQIPIIGETLGKRLWLDARGYILISGYGSQLVRCLIDTCVFQGERLDFAAGAYCLPDGLIERRQGPSAYFGKDRMFMADDLQRLDADEEREYTDLVAVEKDRTKPAADAQRVVWLNARADEALPTGHSAEQRSVYIDDLKATLKDQVLPLSFVVYLEEGKPVTIKEMLAGRGTFDGLMICDPLEPEYRSWDLNTTVTLKHGRAELCSWSHGVRTVFALARFEKITVKTHITAVDRPCGVGKTEGLFKEVLGKADLVNAKILLVVPELGEVQRYLENLVPGGFIEPEVIKSTVIEGTPKTKTEALIEAMQMGKNIVMTHALYKGIRKFSKYLHRYCVVFDEVPNVVEQVNGRVQRKTTEMLRSMGYLTIDPITQLAAVTDAWLAVADEFGREDGTDLDIRKFMRRVQYSETYRVTDNFYTCPLPTEFFTEPRSLTFVTFLLPGSQLDYYMKKLSINCVLQNDEAEVKMFGQDMKRNLALYPRVVEGACGHAVMVGSKSQQRLRIGRYVKKALRELRSDGWIIDSETTLVASANDAWFGTELNPHSKVSDKTCLKSKTGLGKMPHVSMITRGTNKYRKCTVLFILGKLNMNPDQARFLGMNSKLDKLDFELSELIQLLYRTAIREGKKVVLVAPDRANHKLIEGFLK